MASVSATLSAEGPRRTQIIDESGLAAPASSAAFSRGAGYGGWNVPDVVGNIRLDQPWGSADDGRGARGQPVVLWPPCHYGHPSDTWGWVVGAGAHLNLPFIWQGDYVEGEVNYTQGALQYLANSTSITQTNAKGGEQSWGLASDCVLGGTTTGALGTNCELTSAWSAILSYEHYWTPQWRQSLTGGYMAFDYDNAANNMACALEGQGAGVGSPRLRGRAATTTGITGPLARACSGMSPRASTSVLKPSTYSRTPLSRPRDLFRSPLAWARRRFATPQCRGAGSRTRHEWVFTLRMHKDFLP